MAPEAALSKAGNGSDPYGREYSVAGLAVANGAKITIRETVRLPIACFHTLLVMIEKRQLTGRLSVDYSQGTGCSVTWEGGR